MPNDDRARLRYYVGQSLDLDDFTTEQDYHVDRVRRHALGVHTWGIVAGLAIVERDRAGFPGAVDLEISPGHAVDGFGRNLYVFDALPVPRELFQHVTTVELLPLWIAYDEELAGQRVGDACRSGQQPDRTIAGVRLWGGDQIARPTLRVGSQQIPADGPTAEQAKWFPADASVSYQLLPGDDDPSDWLVPLGFVQWDGVQQQFVAAPPDELRRGRRWSRVSVDQVMAPDGTLRIRDRFTPEGSKFDATHAGVAVEVEGSVEVRRTLGVDGQAIARGGVELRDATLTFRDAAGAGVPLDVGRTRDAANNETNLDVTIGDAATPNNRLRVGPAPGGNLTPVFSVMGDARVSVEGTAEIATLDVQGDAAVKGLLDLAQQAQDRVLLAGAAGDVQRSSIAVEPDALTYNAGARHRWRVGGQEVMTVDAQGISVKVAGVDLAVREGLLAGPLYIQGGAWTSFGAPQAGAKAVVEAATNAVYLEVHLTLVTTASADTVHVDLRATGMNSAFRRLTFEGALRTTDTSDAHNDQTYFVWFPKPIDASAPFEYRVVGKSANSTVLIQVYVVGRM
ncbi:MAG: hypothetical protein RIT81_00975 [Deltaproteobacteria bacterium]